LAVAKPGVVGEILEAVVEVPVATVAHMVAARAVQAVGEG
jgi:hypothetical protein